MTLYLGLGCESVKTFYARSYIRALIPSPCGHRNDWSEAPNNSRMPGIRAPTTKRAGLSAGSALVRGDTYGFGGVLLKSTVGAAAAPGAASKYVRAFAPVTLAVSVCGNVRMYVLYCCTAWL